MNIKPTEFRVLLLFAGALIFASIAQAVEHISVKIIKET